MCKYTKVASKYLIYTLNINIDKYCYDAIFSLEIFSLICENYEPKFCYIIWCFRISSTTNN